MYEAALGELALLDLGTAARMGFVNTVLGHVLGSGLALLEERSMRATADLATAADLDRAVGPYLARVAAAGAHPRTSARGRPTRTGWPRHHRRSRRSSTGCSTGSRPCREWQ
ncbi:hypothetical protein PSU4_07760 [Pseudonocardia sulfidoxydans NBRC 16205]|uniref:Uncharacterized protein n=2 Tax=Pseudonocardia sulfidoxydans TaxID=54011 RepID=A0A511DAI9_9PSEU|nr:hypothetical protein PSU4_07760 [Pseudonocardia sulfidoxydans NBRC 16205]